MSESRLILVAGASGYVATRLIPLLLEQGYRVRALARDPSILRNRPWFEQVQVVPGDVLEPRSLPQAMEGVDTAYYLIHNMSGGRGYRHMESEAAQNFGTAARIAGLRQIIYLGGLGDGSRHGHMESRHITGDALRASGPHVIEFRSGVIIGSGSISFEIIRSLANWFPLIPAPTQTNRLAQPIATPDLMRYLLAAIDTLEAHGKVIEIGGPDIHLYPDMIIDFAGQYGLRRWKLPFPLYPLEFSARLVDRLSPVPLSIARPLMQELVGSSVINDPSAKDLFPHINPMTYPEAVSYALERQEMHPESPWIESLVTRRALNREHVKTRGEGFVIDYRELPLDEAPAELQTLLRNGSGQYHDPGWIIRASRPASWIRLERTSEKLGRLYLEIQRKGDVLRYAQLFEPKGLTGNLRALFLSAPEFSKMRLQKEAKAES